MPDNQPRVTVHGKQLKLDGQHLADARDELAAKALGSALQHACSHCIPASEAIPIQELLS